MAILQIRGNADGPGSFSLPCRFVDRFLQRYLCFGQRFALRLGVRKIFAFRDWFDLGNRAGRMIDNCFEELSVLNRVDGKLEFAVLDLKFCRNRLSPVVRLPSDLAAS